jgi:hypothetical protein
MDTELRTSRAGLTVLAAAAFVVAGLLVVAVAGAAAASAGGRMFVHSADSGQLKGGLLTLRGRGIGPRVTWVHGSGRSGVISVARMHRRLFERGKRPATGVLRVAGRELALRLSRPRFSASGHWVRYRAKRLAKRRRAAPASQAAFPRRFGAASLSLVSDRRVGDITGEACPMEIDNNTGSELWVLSASKWDTDNWTIQIIDPRVQDGEFDFGWESVGAFGRGCGNTVVFQVVDDPSVTVTVNTTAQWWYIGVPDTSCTVSSAAYSCYQIGTPPVWDIVKGPPPGSGAARAGSVGRAPVGARRRGLPGQVRKTSPPGMEGVSANGGGSDGL